MNKIKNPIYKYISSKYLDSFLTGKIKVGTLHDFKKIEKYVPEISDPNEGEYNRINPIEEKKTFQNQKDVEDAGLGDFFKLEGEGKNFSVSGITFRTTVSSEDMLIVCFSHTRNDEEMKSRVNYDACIEISNSDVFLKKISATLGSAYIFKGLFKVIYATRDIHWKSPPKVHPAIIKEPQFSYQNELRAIWTRKYENQRLEPKLIQCQKATRRCRRLY